MKKMVDYMNDFLDGVCSGLSFLEFARNNNIYRNQLVDNKHGNDDGFRTMLSNIRYTLFGKVPYFNKHKSKYSNYPT